VGRVTSSGRQYHNFRDLLAAELGLQPTEALRTRLTTGTGKSIDRSLPRRLRSSS
jgi:hypothetical protein